MPRGDRTGPMGMGPMTGRGAGYCGGYRAPGYAYAGRGFGRGLGLGLGRGRGLGWRRFGWPGRGSWYGPRAFFGGAAAAGTGAWGAWEITREEELGYLKGQAAQLKDELDAITRRVGELESVDEEE